MSNILATLVSRFRPHRGWGTLLLSLAALLCLPAALEALAQAFMTPLPVQSLRFMRGNLVFMCFVASLASHALSQSRLSGSLAAMVSLLVGAGLNVASEGQLMPNLALLPGELAALLRLLVGRQALAGQPLPFSVFASDLWARLSGWTGQVWWDVSDLLNGGSWWESHLYLLAAGMTIWMLGFVGVWGIYRRESVLAGLLPSGFLLSILVLHHPPSAAYLLAFLFCTLWLLAVCHLWRRSDSWQTRKVDYPADLGMEVALQVGPIIFALTLLATFLPTSGFTRVSRAFWQQAERAVGPQSGSEGAHTAGTLPRTHLLGGQPNLGQDVVFYVTTNDPPPSALDPGQSTGMAASSGPRRYWRQQTYDVYTGRGWTSSVSESRPLTAWQTLGPDTKKGPELEQRVELVAPGTEFLPASNAPLRLDQPTESWWRGPGDLVRIAGDLKRYAVISRPPMFSIDDLRAAPASTPASVAEFYLTLPESVPLRVQNLAREVTGEADTPFDKAAALEAFIRTYSYTLKLSEPSRNRDLVDYFLFDLQKGYCDYYASAMVVMARAAGIPARLASGYAQGSYDADLHRWVVTEKEAHSWAELYFGGFGWVEFEPTAGQPTIARSLAPGNSLGPVTVFPLPRRAVRWRWDNNRLLMVVAVSIASLALLAVALVSLRGRRRTKHTEPVARVYDSLQAWGIRLGVTPGTGQTPSEYGKLLGSGLEVRRARAHLRRVQEMLPSAAEHLDQIVIAFEHLRYGPRHARGTDTQELVQAWDELRRWLLWLWLDSLVGRQPTSDRRQE